MTPQSCKEQVSNPKREMRLDFFRSIVILRKKTYNQTVGSYLGFVWLILDPLILTMVYLFVFSVIAHREEPAMLFAGLGIIRGLQRSLLTSSSPAFLKSQGGFPIERIRTRVTVASSVMIVATDSFFMGIGISGVLIYLGTDPLNSLAYVVILFASNLWWHSLGICLLIITVRVPDVHKLLMYFGMGMFFISPVLYSFNLTSGLHRLICIYNPATYFIEFSRFITQTQTGVNDLPQIGFFAVPILGVLMLISGAFQMDKIRWNSSNRS